MSGTQLLGIGLVPLSGAGVAFAFGQRLKVKADKDCNTEGWPTISLGTSS